MTYEPIDQAIDEAEIVLPHNTQSEPLPLTRTNSRESPFPKDALLQLKSAADGVHALSEAPYAMCANAVLAAACLAVQGHADVQLPKSGVRPIACYFITVGASGERKTTVDSMALSSVKDRENALYQAYQARYADWKDRKEIWDTARKSILNNKKSNTQQKKLEIEALGKEPREPYKTILTLSEPTYQGLHKYLMTGYPSVGLFSSEGGQFMGGHAMKQDNRTETAAGFNAFWDGDSPKRIRSLDGVSMTFGKRVCMHLMMQPSIAQSLFSDPMLADIGLTGRMLVTYPQSTQGARFGTGDDPQAQKKVDDFSVIMRSLLSQPLPLSDPDGAELTPRVLRLSTEAHDEWLAFDRQIETERGVNGHYAAISGFANKMPEHAARIASVLSLFADIQAREVTIEYMEAGIELARYYAQEAMRMVDLNLTNPDMLLAQKLWDWIKERKHASIPLQDVYQFGPSAIRDAKTAEKLMIILTDNGYLRKLEGGMVFDGKTKSKVWQVVAP